MISHIRMFRVNGDSLSCCFSPQGAMSSALLMVEDTRTDVTSQLPGLRATNAIEYLESLGYRERHSSTVATIGRNLKSLLCGSSLFLESVEVAETHVVLSLARREDRGCACCRRALVALCDRQRGTVRCIASQRPSLQEEFCARLRSLSR